MGKAKVFHCWHCGKEFIGYNDRHYCSTSCAHTNVDARCHEKDLTCQRCGKIFHSQAFRKFCSRLCANRTRAEKATRWEIFNCVRCGKPVTVKPSFARRYRHCSDCHKQISAERIGTFSRGKFGKEHPCYVNGKGYEPYPPEWRKKLKQAILERDYFCCACCGTIWVKGRTTKTFHVHHIDYDKNNCDPQNLITLCPRCNTKVNWNREYWTKYFQEFMQAERV